MLFELCEKRNNLLIPCNIWNRWTVDIDFNLPGIFSGLCQLPLIMSLVRLQNADIELCNSSGMTPLMIAALEGSTILCDVS